MPSSIFASWTPRCPSSTSTTPTDQHNCWRRRHFATSSAPRTSVRSCLIAKTSATPCRFVDINACHNVAKEITNSIPIVATNSRDKVAAVVITNTQEMLSNKKTMLQLTRFCCQQPASAAFIAIIAYVFTLIYYLKCLLMLYFVVNRLLRSFSTKLQINGASKWNVLKCKIPVSKQVVLWLYCPLPLNDNSGFWSNICDWADKTNILQNLV